MLKGIQNSHPLNLPTSGGNAKFQTEARSLNFKPGSLNRKTTLFNPYAIVHLRITTAVIDACPGEGHGSTVLEGNNLGYLSKL